MKTLKSALTVVTLATLTAGLTACGTKNTAPAKHRIDINSIGAAKLTAAATAEEIALAGEQLMSANSFIYADRVFEVALEKDQKNARALFYKKALGPLMALKGFATRIRPALTAEERADLDSYISNTPESGSKAFATAGTGDINSEKEAQTVVDGVIKGLNEFREHLKSSKDEEITVNAPEFLHQQMAQRTGQACVVQEVSSGVFDLTNCDFSRAYQVTLNRADKEVLQQIVAGYQVYFSMLNAYRLDGVAKLARLSKKHVLKSDFVQSYLISQPEWGALRNPQLLGSVLDMGADAIKGIRWVQENQAKICPNGIEQDRSRPGAMFKNGLCVKNDLAMNHSVAIAEALLDGGTTEVRAESGNRVQIRPAVLLSHPIQNLKSQLPIKLDACKRLLFAPDTTVGGSLPNGDLKELFYDTCNGWNFYGSSAG